MSMFSWLWPFGRKTDDVVFAQVTKEIAKQAAPVAPAAPPPPAPTPVAQPTGEDLFYAFRPLFNLLGRSEGTDRGRGYNETLAYGAYTGGPVNLVGMTLAQVDALQTRMLKHPENKMNSSAAGRYQIVRTTLRKLKKTNAIPDTKLFNEEMQDRLCLWLLDGRGLAKYLAGKMAEDQFLTNLAREWASIPTPNGKGYYDGQRNTPVTPSMVREVLKQVKGRIAE